MCVSAIAKRCLFCRMNDTGPEIHKVHVVELCFFDLLVDRPEDARYRFFLVDALIDEVLDQRVVRAVFFWAEPSPYFGNLVDLFCLGRKSGKDLVDLLVLLLQKLLNLSR